MISMAIGIGTVFLFMSLFTPLCYDLANIHGAVQVIQVFITAMFWGVLAIGVFLLGILCNLVSSADAIGTRTTARRE